MESRSENYIKSTLWGLICRVILILLPFMVRTIIIYTIGIEYVGLNSLFSTILQVLSLAELGVGSALTYSMYKPIAEKDREKLCAILNMYKKIYRTIGIIILVVGICIMPFIPKLINGDIPENINIYILYSIYLLNTVSSYILFAYRSSLLNANQRNDIINKINLFITIFCNIIQIIILLTLKNYYLYVIFMPITTVVNNLITACISKKMYPEIICKGVVDEDVKKSIKKQVISLMWHKVGNTIIFSFDTIVISYFLGIRVLGIYNNYFYIYNAIASLFSTFYGAITPGIGNSIILENKQKNYADYKDFCVINIVLTGFCASCLLCLYQSFINIWQGPELMLENTIPILLVVLFVVWHSRRMLHTYKDACGLWEIDKYKPITEAIFNLVTNIILVKLIGLKGIVISTILSMLIVGIPWENFVFIKKYFNEQLTKYYTFTFFNVLKIAITIIISYIICSLIPNIGVLYFILKILVCIIVTSIILILLFYKEKAFVRIKEIIRGRLKNV
ncbi:MAG: oligosaccharide flippase family protein [Clostridia bacterium]|nr:oligosaccharide flippase family protein [Clostridia bacterium]